MASDVGAAGDSRPRLRGAHYLIAVAVVFALVSGGYHVGRDMAHRDNVRAEGLR